jgi:hypothetical protein
MVKQPILDDLGDRDPDWLHETSKAAASTVEADFAEWKPSNA